MIKLSPDSRTVSMLVYKSSCRKRYKAEFEKFKDQCRSDMDKNAKDEKLGDAANEMHQRLFLEERERQVKCSWWIRCRRASSSAVISCTVSRR